MERWRSRRLEWRMPPLFPKSVESSCPHLRKIGKSSSEQSHLGISGEGISHQATSLKRALENSETKFGGNKYEDLYRTLYVYDKIALVCGATKAYKRLEMVLLLRAQAVYLCITKENSSNTYEESKLLLRREYNGSEKHSRKFTKLKVLRLNE